MARHLMIVAAAALMVVQSPLAAQRPSWGLSLATRGPGVIWRPVGSMALRADFVGSRSDNSSTGRVWNVSSGVSGLLYQHEQEGLQTYFGPRAGYGLTYYSLSSARVHQYSGSLLAGVQYTLSGRFAVQGEAAITYSEAHEARPNAIDDPFPRPLNTLRTFSVGNSLGVVYFFR